MKKGNVNIAESIIKNSVIMEIEEPHFEEAKEEFNVNCEYISLVSESIANSYLETPQFESEEKI